MQAVELSLERELDELCRGKAAVAKVQQQLGRAPEGEMLPKHLRDSEKISRGKVPLAKLEKVDGERAEVEGEGAKRGEQGCSFLVRLRPDDGLPSRLRRRLTARSGVCWRGLLKVLSVGLIPWKKVAVRDGVTEDGGRHGMSVCRGRGGGAVV